MRKTLLLSRRYLCRSMLFYMPHILPFVPVAKQLLRSATSVCANINEAIYVNSKADFISKLHISLKETGESIYWLTLLKRTNLIDYDFEKLLSLAEEIKRMLIASLNTAKENKQ